MEAPKYESERFPDEVQETSHLPWYLLPGPRLEYQYWYYGGPNFSRCDSEGHQRNKTHGLLNVCAFLARVCRAPS